MMTGEWERIAKKLVLVAINAGELEGLGRLTYSTRPHDLAGLFETSDELVTYQSRDLVWTLRLNGAGGQAPGCYDVQQLAFTPVPGWRFTLQEDPGLLRCDWIHGKWSVIGDASIGWEVQPTEPAPAGLAIVHPKSRENPRPVVHRALLGLVLIYELARGDEELVLTGVGLDLDGLRETVREFFASAQIPLSHLEGFRLADGPPYLDLLLKPEWLREELERRLDALLQP